MKEIKFRSWKNGEMISDNELENWTVYELLGGGHALMQYTGLKDKNGKEIYEGDLLFYKGNYYEVVWYDKNARWSYLGSGITPKSIKNIHRVAEVKSNIYENPNYIKK